MRSAIASVVLVLSGCSVPPPESARSRAPAPGPWRVLEAVEGRFGRLEVLVLPGGRAAGLEARDLVIDYESVYDVVMGGFDLLNPRGRLEELGGQGGNLLVLSGGRRKVIEVPKR